jgi:3-hydroxybutyryl-CoA dehydrogenase
MVGRVTALPDVIGVVGAGTMGAGIAQLAAATGARTLVHDPNPTALRRGAEAARDGLQRWRDRGRLDREPGPLDAVGELEALAPCGLVVEAAPERLELKRELLGRLAAIAPDAVLASNTSSIPITALGTAAGDPGRVVGMHFFNPAPVMRLVEVIAGLESGAEALAVARAVGAAMGKRVVDAADGPGFLVNRCSRPFGLEALRLVQDGVADVEVVDRVCRLGGGFPMGPFELQDLVGLDVGLEVARSFHEQSFGEPRWRPSPLSARMVAAGRLGRKAGRGWYAYPRAADADPAPPAAGGGDGRTVVVTGEWPLARDLRAAAGVAGFDVRERAGPTAPWLTLDCAGEGEHAGPAARLLARGSLLALDPGGASAGFHALGPLAGASLVELARGPGTDVLAAERTEALFAALGKHTVWVADAPGLVLGRIVAQLANEACFAVAEGVGAPEDVDHGMVLGLNHPRGPFAWARATGAPHLLAILDALRGELGEERYRAAPLLRRMAVAT